MTISIPYMEPTKDEGANWQNQQWKGEGANWEKEQILELTMEETRN